MHRIYDEHQNRARYGAQERTKKWDDIGKSDDDADQRGIGRPHNGGSDKAQNTNDNRVHNLSAQKSDKGLMGKAEILNQCVGSLLLKKRVGNLLGLTGKAFLACQNIDGNDETDDKIPHKMQHPDHAQGNRLDQLHGVGQNVRDQLFQFSGIFIHGFEHIILQLRIVLQRPVQPHGKVCCVIVKIGDQALYTGHNLGNQHGEYHINQCHKQKSRDKDTHSSDNGIPFFGFPDLTFSAQRQHDFCFNKIQYGSKQISDGHSHHHGHQNIDDGADPRVNIGTMKHKIIKNDS